MQNRAAASYATQQIMTASPAELVALLYERAIRALRDAIRAIELGDIAARCNHNGKAIEIVAHMLTTLDRERGKEIAASLDKILRVAMRKLSEVDMHNDTEAARAVIALLEPLAQSWRQLAAQNAAAARPTAPVMTATAARPSPLALSA